MRIILFLWVILTFYSCKKDQSLQKEIEVIVNNLTGQPLNIRGTYIGEEKIFHTYVNTSYQSTNTTIVNSYTLEITPHHYEWGWYVLNDIAWSNCPILLDEEYNIDFPSGCNNLNQNYTIEFSSNGDSLYMTTSNMTQSSYPPWDVYYVEYRLRKTE